MMDGTARRKSIHGLWTSKLAFILAATGSAVGLGNIWKFPYVTGENGGAAFVLLYLLCVLLIGLPILMAEVLIGRRGRRNPINAIANVAYDEIRSSRWRYIGIMGVAAGFMILSFYSVIAGWTMAYTVRVATGLFEGVDADFVVTTFDVFVSDPERLLAWHTLFMVITVSIVSKGVNDGLERAVRYLMPALFLILVALVLYATTLTGFSTALTFLFEPDFDKLWRRETILAAMGMAFFSLSLGMGALMMYGSYLPDDTSIAKTSLVVAAADTTVAMLAGLAIFPLVFTFGLQPEQGSGLIFKTLPLAFSQMQFGSLIGTGFFVLLVLAAVTSAMSLLEPPVAWLIENKNMTRETAARLCGIVVWLLGLGTVFSFNVWQPYQWTFTLDLGIRQYLLWENKTFFDVIDFLTSNVMLPLGGFLIAVFVAFKLRKASIADELRMSRISFNLWYLVIRFVTPVLVGFIFLNSVGLINFILPG